MVRNASEGVAGSMSIEGRKDSSPPAQAVADFHKYSDLDKSPEAQHHSLGMGPGQAAPGNHNHNGTNSGQLLLGVNLTGSRAGGAALLSVIQALVQLGATDGTTP